MALVLRDTLYKDEWWILLTHRHTAYSQAVLLSSLSPSPNSQIQVWSLKSRVQSQEERDWDWGWQYNHTGHHLTPQFRLLISPITQTAHCSFPNSKLQPTKGSSITWPYITFHDLLCPKMTCKTFYELNFC